ncbi:hypothetical protein Hanom_Chr07g00600211 [Helianthus anomalus]
MATGEEFSESYLLVNAKEASLYDIACILIRSTSFLNTKNFYNEQSEHVGRSAWDDIRRRFVIFASIVAQKVLMWAEKPIAEIGSLIELWLNLLSSNGGFFGLLINYIRGYFFNYVFILFIKVCVLEQGVKIFHFTERIFI